MTPADGCREAGGCFAYALAATVVIKRRAWDFSPMRLWSISPSYLDPIGLVALWREALLAQSVLQGKTRGYRNHPQLERFKMSRDPLLYIGTYLYFVHQEAVRRGYRFDPNKIAVYDPGIERLPISEGQLRYEMDHLLRKLANRAPEWRRKLAGIRVIEPHPIFRPVPGGVEEWERVHHRSGVRK